MSVEQLKSAIQAKNSREAINICAKLDSIDESLLILAIEEFKNSINNPIIELAEKSNKVSETTLNLFIKNQNSSSSSVQEDQLNKMLNIMQKTSEPLSLDSLKAAIDKNSSATVQQISDALAKQNIKITFDIIQHAIEKIGSSESGSNSKNIFDILFKNARSENIFTQESINNLIKKSIDRRCVLAFDKLIDELIKKQFTITNELINYAIEKQANSGFDYVKKLFDAALTTKHTITSAILNHSVIQKDSTSRGFYIPQICEKLVKLKCKFDSTLLLNALTNHPGEKTTRLLLETAIQTESSISEDVLLKYLENGNKNYQGFDLHLVPLVVSSQIDSHPKSNSPILFKSKEYGWRTQNKLQLHVKDDFAKIKKIDTNVEAFGNALDGKFENTETTLHVSNQDPDTTIYTVIRNHYNPVSDMANRLAEAIGTHSKFTEKSLLAAIQNKNEYLIITIYNNLALQKPQVTIQDHFLYHAFKEITDEGRKKLTDIASKYRPNDLIEFLDCAINLKQVDSIEYIVGYFFNAKIKVSQETIISTMGFPQGKSQQEIFLLLLDYPDEKVNTDLVVATLNKYPGNFDLAQVVFNKLPYHVVSNYTDFDDFMKKSGLRQSTSSSSNGSSGGGSSSSSTTTTATTTTQISAVSVQQQYLTTLENLLSDGRNGNPHSNKDIQNKLTPANLDQLIKDNVLTPTEKLTILEVLLTTILTNKTGNSTRYTHSSVGFGLTDTQKLHIQYLKNACIDLVNAYKSDKDLINVVSIVDPTKLIDFNKGSKPDFFKSFITTDTRHVINHILNPQVSNKDWAYMHKF